MKSTRGAATACAITWILLTLAACAARRDLNPSPAATSGASSTAPSDLNITEAVSLKLFADRYFSPDEIKVVTDAGIVSLTGLVNDLRSRDRAVRLAEGIRGVRAVVDRLSLRAVSRPDSRIRAEVSQALLSDPTTGSYHFRVKVKDGVVFLTGEAPTWAGKNLTAWVAEGVPGVRDVHDDLTVDSRQKRTDIEIMQDIEDRLSRDPVVMDYRVTAQILHGRVNLVGIVASAAARRNAYEDAWVADVRSVGMEELKVDPALSAGSMARRSVRPPSDSDIRSAIRSAMLWDPRVDFNGVMSSVTDGAATLRGKVSSLAARQSAEDDARDTVGVSSVVDRIEIDQQKRSDAALVRAVHRSLAWNLSRSAASSVDVTVRNGVVTLNGAVKSPYERWQYRDAVTRVRGVAGIDNEIRIQGATDSRADGDLQARIEGEVSADPELILDTGKIGVSVHQGVAHLTGNVGGWSDRWAATLDAFDAGATAVENELGVQGLTGPARVTHFDLVPAMLPKSIPIPVS